jgi:hypothetical protein
MTKRSRKHLQKRPAVWAAGILRLCGIVAALIQQAPPSIPVCIQDMQPTRQTPASQALPNGVKKSVKNAES